TRTRLVALEHGDRKPRRREPPRDRQPDHAGADDRDIGGRRLPHALGNRGAGRGINPTQRPADNEWNIRLAAQRPPPALFFSEGSEFLAEPEIQSLRRYEPVQVQRISAPPTSCPKAI